MHIAEGDLALTMKKHRDRIVHDPDHGQSGHHELCAIEINDPFWSLNEIRYRD